MENNRQISIAVIDSGIDYEYSKKYLLDSILGGISYEIINNTIDITTDFHDKCGHGTACVSLINKYVENAKFYIVKILNSKGLSNSEVLLMALTHLLTIDVKLINLSLSITADTFNLKIIDVCKKLAKQGKIIISSKSNKSDSIAIPASLENVIGVEAANSILDFNEFWFNKDYEIQAITSGIPEMVYKKIDDIDFFWGNSKATALFTSIVANLFKTICLETDYFSLQKILHNTSMKHEWTEIEKHNMPKIENLVSDKPVDSVIINRIENVISDYLKLNDSLKHKLYTNMLLPEVGLAKSKCYPLLKLISQELGLVIKYEKFNLLDFSNIYILNSSIEMNSG